MKPPIVPIGLNFILSFHMILIFWDLHRFFFFFFHFPFNKGKHRHIGREKSAASETDEARIQVAHYYIEKYYVIFLKSDL